MVRAQSFKIKYAFAYSARNTKKFCIFERKSVKFFSILLHCIKIYDKIVETKCVKGCEDMRKMHKIFALALGSVLSLSAFAACGGGDVNSTGDAQNYQICFDNLDDSISLDSSATQVAVADANVVAAYDEDGNPVNDWESIATYENGVFTGVSAGRVRYQLSDGTTGSIEVVAAYPTNPDYDYAGNALDFSETGDQGEKVLGRTHDPSLIEVRNERGESIYYMFSTGWSDQSVYNGVTTYGNAIHVSYDGMKTWEFLGRTFDYATRETEVVNSKIGEWLYGDFTSLNNFFEDQDDMTPEEIKAGAKEMASWWAPDIVPKPDGSGYWLYTCVVDGAPQLDTTTSVGGIEIDGETYTRACILLYESETLEPGSFKPVMKDNQPVVLMQSSIDVSLPIQDADNSSADRRYYGNVNGIDPQIIYTPDGKMYMAYGSFGSGNYILELDPATGLRKDGQNSWQTHETIFGYRDQVEERFTSYTDEDGNAVGWTHDYYGKNISKQFMEAPVIARHDNVTLMDEEGNALEGSGKTFYYSMHSYDPLADNYQMWGGRSENVMGLYTSVNGGIVRNVGAGNEKNQGNKYMGSFEWTNKPDASPELDAILPGHNDLFTTNSGTNVAAYITRASGAAGSFTVQLHQYYLNSYGDICINPNRYAGESTRAVSADELFTYTEKAGDYYKFEMVVLTNSGRDNSGTVSSGDLTAANKSRTVLLSRDEGGNTGKIFESTAGEDGTLSAGEEIGTWKMYGNGYIKFEFPNETLKGTGTYNSEEKVYYGVVRTAWLNDQNKSGFAITSLGHSNSVRSMAMFMNNYSTISGDGLVGTDYSAETTD